MPLCDLCGERPATIFLTKIVGNESTERKLCEQCAQESIASAQALLGDLDLTDASAADMIRTLFEQAVAAGLLTPEEAEELQASGELAHLQIGDISEDDMADFLEEASRLGFETDDSSSEAGEFSDDMDDDVPPSGIDFDEMLRQAREEERRATAAAQNAENKEPSSQNADAGQSAEAGHEELDDTSGGISPASPSHRCPKCNMTWDRLKQDGRAGCAQCYVAFANELHGVMNKMQRGTHHIGKEPRTALKRRRRLEHLRARRDHQLEMLQRRLKESIESERYEEAAKLRDRIKIVSSTIVNDENH